jgi:hypothetical protein
MAANVTIINEIESIQVSDSFICSPEQCNLHVPQPSNMLKIFHVNIRSITKNFKMLLPLLHRINIQLDVIILTECWLSKCLSLPTLPGFTSYSSIYRNQNDGTVVYVKDDLPHTCVIPEFKDASCLLVKISNKMAILAVYRSPSYKCTENFMSSLDTVLSTLKSFNSISVIGDININIISNDLDVVAETYLNIVASHAMLPVHAMPTRNANCLDHVMLKTRSTAVTMVLTSFITDHAPVILCCNINPDRYNTNRTSKHVNMNSCVSELHRTDLTFILACNDAEKATTLLVKTVADIVTKHTRETNIPSRKRIIKPWITPGLLRCLRNRDKLYKKSKKDPNNMITKITYNRYKNFINNLIKKVKIAYEKAEFEKVKNNSKATWKLIKKVGNIQRSRVSPCQLLLGSAGTPISAIDNINRYFANIGKDLAAKITHTTPMKTKMISPSNSMSLFNTDFDEIERIINRLNNTPAVGWDGIPTTIIKSAKRILIPALVHVFNLCLESGVFPQAFKIAILHPIYKSGDRGSVNNYRPISILTAFSKILEKILNKRLLDFLDSHNIIAENQYGFRKNKSTEDAVLNLTEAVVRNLEHSLKTIGIFLDLSKAFDTVSAPLLLDKLSNIGIRGVALNIFKSYLSNRTQRVVIDDLVSSDEEINFGVPQGSVLGPTLFTIYINDLCRLALPNCKTFIYADDTALLVYGSDWNATRNNAEFVLHRVMSWLNCNLLTLNLDKTNFITFAASTVSLPSPSLSIYAHKRSPNVCSNCDCIQIRHTTDIKYLGVWIDNTLSWKEHIKVTRGRVRKLIYIFKNLRSIIDVKTLKSVYCALGLSILTYCISVWGGSAETHIMSLERAQRIVLKVMISKPIRFPTSELYEITDVLTVRQMFILHVILRKHSQLTFNPAAKTNKRRTDLVCKTIFCRLTLARRHFDFIASRMYNKVNKILQIFPLLSRECKFRVSSWLKSLTQNDTENFIKSCL